MSYCVNCGVELSPSERRCPLCGTEVMNPRSPGRSRRCGLTPTGRADAPPGGSAVCRGAPCRGAGHSHSSLPCSAIFSPTAGSRGRSKLFGALTMLMVWILPPLAASRYHRLRFLSLDGAAVSCTCGASPTSLRRQLVFAPGLPLAAGAQAPFCFWCTSSASAGAGIPSTARRCCSYSAAFWPWAWSWWWISIWDRCSFSGRPMCSSPAGFWPRQRGWWPDGRKFGRKLQNASFIKGFLGHLGKFSHGRESSQNILFLRGSL